MPPQICLGTAQFGLDYGITNISGQVSGDKVAHLLFLAEQNNICFLDTARAYGDSETVIGDNLPSEHRFHFISKFQAQHQQYFSSSDIYEWENAFHQSCKNLKVTRLGSFLLHSTDDLRKEGSPYLIEWLLDLKSRGLVDRLGVSIYNSEDLLEVPTELLDIVQLPLSIYDQRLLKDGTINSLAANGTAIHARSIYLQGLLLAPSSHWPNWLSKEIIDHHSNLEAFAIERECELIDLAIGFALQQKALEAIVLGICDSLQFEQLINTWARPSPWHNKEWEIWSLNHPRLLDPRLWPR